MRSVEPCSKLRVLGVDVGEHVSLRYVRKTARGKAMTANRIRENRPSGMIGGHGVSSEGWRVQWETVPAGEKSVPRSWSCISERNESEEAN